MPLRISGMVTGLDTDTIVKQLMQAKRIPIDRMKQQQTQLEWKRDAYREQNTLLNQLRDLTFKLRLQSSMGAKKALSSAESIVTATPGGTAVNGSYSIKVNEIAAGATLRSTALGISNKTSEPLNTTQAYTLNVSGEKGSKQITIPKDSTIDNVVATINGQSLSTGVRAAYDKITDRLTFTSTGTGSQALVSISGTDAASEGFLTGTLKVPVSATDRNVITGTKVYANTSVVINANLTSPVEFSVNGSTLTITKETTIADLQDQLSRSAAGADVTLTLDASGKLRLEGGSAITLANVTGAGLEEVGLTGAGVSNAMVKTAFTRGTDANIDFNGLTGIRFHTNNITQGDINFTLKDKGTATVTVGSDPDSVFTTIKTFVEKYNEIAAKIYDKTHEEVKRDFKPLTEDQRKEMKEDEIKKWEEAAKKGLLRNDTILNGALNELRQALANPLAGIGVGQYGQLAEIGITSGKYYERGKLYLDEAALKKALTERPDEVMNLFTKQGARYNPNTTATGTKAYTEDNPLLDSTLSGTYSFMVNGKQIDLTSTMRLSDLQKQLSDKTEGKVTAYLDASKKLVIQSTGTTPLVMSNVDPAKDALGALGHVEGTTDVTKSAGTKSFASGSTVINGNLSSPIRFTLNGKYFTIDKTTTVDSLSAQIFNSTSGTVTLSRDAGTGKLMLQGTSETQLVINNTDVGVDALAELGFQETKYSENGVLADPNSVGLGHRIHEIINMTINKVTERAGSIASLKDTSVLGEQISDVEKRINSKNRSLAEYEQRLYSQYARLESFISKMNSQSAWLSQQMGAMNMMNQ